MTRKTTYLRHAGYMLVVLAAALFLNAQALAQSAGAISGRVTDQGSNNYLVGAEVRLVGTDRVAATDRTGAYELSNVPAGLQTIEVSYLSSESKTLQVSVTEGQRAAADVALASDVIQLETFRVESIREGQSRAINQQRASNTISNIISSDAIGNLPDNTIAEALARLPGVNVVVEGGSAAFASIRGSEAKLNSVTLDGERFTASSPGGMETNSITDTRAVDLSLIPSELVGGIEVIKALTADKDADSFGGTINLVTRSAYDLPGRTLNGKFEFLHNDFGNRGGYSAALTYADVLNEKRTLGVSATLNFRDQDSVLDDYEIPYYRKSNSQVANIAGVTDEGIQEFDARSTNKSRKTIGGALNLDCKLSDRTEWHLRSFYDDTTIGVQDYLITQFRNGATQDITGLEISWQQSFAKLPAPFDGFGLNANVTFVDGKSTFFVLDPVTGQQTTSTEDLLPGQAKKVYNAQLYWEKYGFTARVAVNYTDEFVREAGGLVANVVNYPATRWDATMSYRLTKHFTIYVEGKNLSEEVKSWYAGKPSKPEEWEFNGWSGVAGVKWRF